MNPTPKSDHTVMTIDALRQSPLNVRTNAEDNGATAALESSILAFGLLKPLIVHPFKGSKPKKFGVLAGGRRYRAIRNLVDRGDLPADWPIDCMLRDLPEGELIEVSLAENISKELRPYEIYAAVARVVARGIPISQIAENYGQTEHEIRQLVRLGTLAPPIFAALEAGELTIKQAKAYAATEDHALQLRAWEALHRDHWKHTPDRIHAAMNIGEAEAAKLLAFVGAEAYRDAGGRYELDLFADDGEERGRVVDTGLLRNLADAKLEDARTRLRKRTNRPELRFADAPRSTYGGIDYQLQVEAKLAPLDGFDAARVAELERAIADCEEMAEEHFDEDDAPLPGSEEALAAIDVMRERAETELAEMHQARRFILPGGDIIAWLSISNAGVAEVTYWWPDWKAKRAHDKAIQSGLSLKPIGTPAPAATAPKILDGQAVRGPSTAAAALVREEHGVSADSIDVMRSIRRELLRALLVEDAERIGAGNTGTDYVVWSTLRIALGDGRPERTGARGLAYGGEIGGTDLAAKAREHVEAADAHRVWEAAIAQLSRCSFLTEPDHAAAFLDYLAESAATKRLAGAVLAGLALERSANAPGYRIAVHDALAIRLSATPATLRRLFTPTAEFLELVPRAHRLAIAEPLVDKPTYDRWAKVKAGELTNLLARALGAAGNSVRQGAKQLAAEWVHPLLSFRPLDLSKPAPSADDDAAEQATGSTQMLEAAE